MNTIKYLLCVGTLIIGVTGCAVWDEFVKDVIDAKPPPTLSEAMQSWVGSHKSKLIASSWGKPSRIESDGNGGQILVYEERVPKREVSIPRGNSRLDSGPDFSQDQAPRGKKIPISNAANPPATKNNVDGSGIG